MKFNEFKVKFKEACETAKYKVNEATTWVIENPEKALGVLSIASMAVGMGAKAYKKISRIAREQEAAIHMYCGTVNRSVRLTHPLSDREIKQLASLMSTGLTRYEALNVMGVIK